jgi:hypothetical protein
LKKLKLSYPKLDCSPDATFTDKADDANEILVGTPTPSQPALDVVRSYVTWDGKAKAVTLHVAVKDIKQQPPTGSTGSHVDYEFGIGAVGYIIRATHDLVAGDSADLESPIQNTVSDAVDFKVDDAHNEYTLTMPADIFAKITDPKAKGPMLGPGVQISGLTVTTRRSEGARLIINADEAAGLCPFVVPDHGSITAATVPGDSGPGGDGFLPSAPLLVGAQTVRNLVPSVVFAVLVGACVATWTGRRRRGLAVV